MLWNPPAGEEVQMIFNFVGKELFASQMEKTL
jgi:hypothetical protein